MNVKRSTSFYRYLSFTSFYYDSTYTHIWIRRSALINFLLFFSYSPCWVSAAVVSGSLRRWSSRVSLWISQQRHWRPSSRGRTWGKRGVCSYEHFSYQFLVAQCFDAFLRGVRRASMLFALGEGAPDCEKLKISYLSDFLGTTNDETAASLLPYHWQFCLSLKGWGESGLAWGECAPPS